jgi:hypothetical protein
MAICGLLTCNVLDTDGTGDSEKSRSPAIGGNYLNSLNPLYPSEN